MESQEEGQEQPPASQQPQPTQATNSQEVVRSSLQQLDKGDRDRLRIR